MCFKKIFLLPFLLLGTVFCFAQAPYNNCVNAFPLCPNKTYTLNNIGANATVCANCEDDFTYCFSGENTIWMTFTTNAAGGDINVSFSNLQFQVNPGQGNELQAAIIFASLPCISSSYTLLSTCVANETTDFSLAASGLLPNTTYFVIVNGAKGTSTNAEASFNVQISGTAVNRNPTLGINAQSFSICKGNTETFTAHTTGCTNQSVFSWFVNGVLIGKTLDSTFSYDGLSDNDVVTAKVACFNNCRDTLLSNSLLFNVDSFLVDAGPDLHIQEGESIQIQGQTSGTNITWTPPYNMNNPSTIRPVVHPQATTTYFLTVSNGSCSITDEMTVFVNKGLVIPNTFSPNGDGINDEWEILGIEKFPNCHIEVYDRWGQLVFQTTGYPQNKRWKGNSKTGKALAAGAYYYVISLQNQKDKKPLKGVVSIIH